MHPNKHKINPTILATMDRKKTSLKRRNHFAFLEVKLDRKSVSMKPTVCPNAGRSFRPDPVPNALVPLLLEL